MTTIDIGGALLAPFLDAGSGWKGLYFSKNEDWYSLSQSKARGDSRPNAHGSFGGGPDWREQLVVSVEGGFIGSDEAAALNAMDDLKRVWAQGTLQLMTVTDTLRPTSRWVSVRFLTIPDHYGRDRFTFSLDTTADDPRRYGPGVRVATGLPVSGGGLAWPITWPIMWGAGGSDGRVTVTNPGTADSFSLLEVTGQLDAGFTIDEVGTGRQVRFERFIPLGSTVFLNPRTGRAYIDAPGNDVSGFLTRTDWPSAPAGGTSTLQFNSLGSFSGTPTLTAQTAPAYW